jgi:hypothetical protein
MEELKIRPLTNRDFFTVVDMLSKISGTAGRELRGLIISDKKTEKPKNLTEKKAADKQAEEMGIQIAMIIFNTCYEHVRQDLINWFASLCGMTADDYLDNLPPDATLQIMEQLAEAQESTSFFTHALRLFKRMNKSGNLSTEKSN